MLGQTSSYTNIPATVIKNPANFIENCIKILEICFSFNEEDKLTSGSLTIIARSGVKFCLKALYCVIDRSYLIDSKTTCQYTLDKTNAGRLLSMGLNEGKYLFEIKHYNGAYDLYILIQRLAEKFALHRIASNASDMIAHIKKVLGLLHNQHIVRTQSGNVIDVESISTDTKETKQEIIQEGETTYEAEFNANLLRNILGEYLQQYAYAEQSSSEDAKRQAANAIESVRRELTRYAFNDQLFYFYKITEIVEKCFNDPKQNLTYNLKNLFKELQLLFTKGIVSPRLILEQCHVFLERIYADVEKGGELARWNAGEIVDLYNQALSDYIHIRDFNLKHMPLPWKDTFAWQENRKKLQLLRSKAHEEFETLNSPDEIHALQKSYTKANREFLIELCQQVEAILGKSPCDYAWVVMGSMAREEMTPFSDIEPLLLVEKDPAKDADVQRYFYIYTTLLQLQIRCLGETESFCPGFHLDGDKYLLAHKDPEPPFITTPEAFINRWYPIDVETANPACLSFGVTYSPLKAAYLYGSSDNLFIRYQKVLQQRLDTLVPGRIRTLREGLCKASIHDDIRQYIHHANTFKLAYNWENSKIDLKQGLIKPIISLLTSLAIAFEIDARHSADIIKALLAKTSVTTRLPESLALALTDALGIVQWCRWRCQFEAGRQFEKTSLKTCHTWLAKFDLAKTNLLRQSQNGEVDLLAIARAAIAPFHAYLAPWLYQGSLMSPDKRGERELNVSGVIKSWLSDEQAQWDAMVQQLIVPEAGDAPGIRLSWFVLENTATAAEPISKLREGLLRPEIAELLIDSSGKPKEDTDYPAANHPVKHCRLGLVDMHAKLFPELPGLEIAVYVLNQLLNSHGSAPVIVGKLSIPLASGATRIEPVLLSRTVYGMNMAEVCVKHNHMLNLLDLFHTAQQTFAHLMIRPEDAKPDSFVLQPILNAQGELSYRVIGVDNDHAFQEPLVTTGGLRNKTVLQTKAILYCVDAMLKAVNEDALSVLQKIDPAELLKHWLGILDAWDSAIRDCFGEKEIERYLKRKDIKKTTLPVLIEGETVRDLFQCLSRLNKHSERWLTSLRQKLRESRSRLARGHVTLIDVLQTIEPLLGMRYVPPLRVVQTPLERFDKLTSSLYSQVVAGHHKTAEGNMLVQRSGLRKIPKKEDVLKRNKYRPNKCINFLTHAIEKQMRDIVEARKLLMSGDARGYKVLPWSLPQEYVINDISFTPPPKTFSPKQCDDYLVKQGKQQQFILKAILECRTAFNELFLRHWHSLTDKQLMQLIKNSPELTHLDISGCKKITSQSLAYLCNQLHDKLLSLTISGTQAEQVGRSLKPNENFTVLRELIADDCPELVTIDLQQAASLQNLRLRRCPKLENVLLHSTLTADPPDKNTWEDEISKLERQLRNFEYSHPKFAKAIRTTKVKAIQRYIDTKGRKKTKSKRSLLKPKANLNDYKLVVLGSGGTNKSALTVQFVQGVFVEKYDPTIEDSYRKSIEIDGRQCNLEILDTAGTEQFTAMRDLYMKNGQGFILVFSLIAQSTFNDIPDMREQILRVKDTDDIPMILVGSKCDLAEQRVITTEQGKALARRFNCQYIEASAKTKVNVEKIFFEIVREINLKAERADADYWHPDSPLYFAVTHNSLKVMLKLYAGETPLEDWQLLPVLQLAVANAALNVLEWLLKNYLDRYTNQQLLSAYKFEHMCNHEKVKQLLLPYIPEVILSLIGDDAIEELEWLFPAWKARILTEQGQQWLATAAKNNCSKLIAWLLKYHYLNDTSIRLIQEIATKTNSKEVLACFELKPITSIEKVTKTKPTRESIYNQTPTFSFFSKERHLLPPPLELPPPPAAPGELSQSHETVASNSSEQSFLNPRGSNVRKTGSTQTEIKIDDTNASEIETKIASTLSS